jgi:anthranilate synthase/aminodeoxychorismate synthase-like glutamine amidotransferase
MILLIDNYDSFTHNLWQALGACAGGEEVRVVRNDALAPGELVALAPRRVVLSPGPGHPAASRLSLLAPQLFPDTPLLGVCLGHQALALCHGGRVVRSPRPTHGRAVAIHHDGAAPFAALPGDFEAALYHSLMVEPESLPACLRVAARSPAGDIMALRHVDRPHVGVQFHPESFLTPDGPALLAAFLEG